MRVLLAGEHPFCMSEVGKYMQNTFEWLHIDIAGMYTYRSPQFDRFKADPVRFVHSYSDDGRNRPVVISWGYGEHHGYIAKMLVNVGGYTPVWFTGAAHLLRASHLEPRNNYSYEVPKSKEEARRAQSFVEGWNVVDVFRLNRDMMGERDLARTVIRYAREDKRTARSTM